VANGQSIQIGWPFCICELVFAGVLRDLRAGGFATNLSTSKVNTQASATGNLLVIETRQLTKRYGDLIAVNHIDLKLEEGDVFGFIGPNGSGKTTTMRMLATLLQPDYGEAYVCGKSIYTDPQEIRRLVGFMPDFFGVYEDMTVVEYLEFFAAAYRVPLDKRRKVVEDKLELVDMAFKRNAMVNQLSRGQTQRVGLARVLLHEPQVLLLDEPASGLDPRARIEIRNLLKRLGELKKTVIVSSHILPELADVCTRVGMIEKGNLIIDGNVDEVMRKARNRILLHIRVKERTDDAARLLEQLDEVTSVVVNSSGQIEVALKPEVLDYSALPTALIEAGFKLTLFREEEVNLETAFMELTKGLVQ
jgi:ABC-2 type transport system ATP-binding protein